VKPILSELRSLLAQPPISFCLVLATNIPVGSPADSEGERFIRNAMSCSAGVPTRELY
jgi:hypothetical protein